MTLTVEVRDKDMVRRAVLADHDLEGALVAPQHNDVGVWRLELPDRLQDVPHEGCWWLRQPGSGVVVSDGGRVVLSGPCESREREVSVSAPEGLWTFTGVSDLHVLDVEQAWPDPSRPVTAQTTRSNDVRSGPAETLLHAYVGANIGSGSLRPRLLMGADLGRGTVRTESPRYESLLELCRRIAGTEVCFDVVQDGDRLRFVTWVPADRTVDVQLDVAFGALASHRVSQAAPSVTRAIVLGQGEGVARQVRLVTTPESLAAEAVWGVRCVVIDQRQTDDVNELDRAGLDAIEDGMQTVSSEASPSDDAGFRDVRPGDWVTVTVDEPGRAQLTGVPMVVRGGVLVGLTVGEPLSGDEAVMAVLSGRQAKFGERLSRLERGV